MQDIQSHFRETLWKNFAAAIDMLGEAIRLCPDALWQRRERFFYMSYHTVIFLDYYLSQPVRDFDPPLAYTLVDQDHLPEHAIDDVIPNETYSRDDIMRWLASIRARARSIILDSSDAQLMGRWIQDDELHLHLGCPSLVKDYSVTEILFYNFRHVQHHVAQLNTILRVETGSAADWISHAD